MADQTIQTLHPFLKQQDTEVEPGVTIRSHTAEPSGRSAEPILCVVHGYPESSYMWRHVIPLLKDRISLFIPELPGYGISSLPPKSDKRTVGSLIIKALQSVFGTERKVIWCGHDRGARVGHRLLVDNEPSHNIAAAVLMDIVPILEQWRVFANPRASTAYYHWPFLAADIAPAMIEQMGGGYWCQINLNKIKGPNPAGVKKFKENDAWDHYSHQFSKPECIAGSCADYAAGAGIDCEEQRKDQEAGRKVKVPLKVLYSASNLGSMHDVPSVWENWAEGKLECVGLTECGHFLPEEAPEQTANAVISFLDDLDGVKT